jgi:L-ribulose-5-phosphate 4-epimerase
VGGDAEIRDVLQQIRKEVAALHDHLPRNSLVVWTAGNVSGS